MGENTLVVVTGAFTRVVTWIPYRRIQSLNFSQDLSPADTVMLPVR